MRNWHRLLIIGLGVIVLVALALIVPGEEGAIAQGDTIYVDADASGANNGDSWADAYTNLQLALDRAEEEDQIWVAEGTYTPTEEHGGSGDRYKSFQMVNGVAIYGGFDPSVGHIEWEDRDWVAHPTILSGDLDGDDGENFANNEENSYHVFYHPEEYVDLDSTAVLDGFTITGGNANDSGFPHNVGGGMQNYYSSPMLTNCTFEGNSANFGGGMFNSLSTPMLANCAFRGNSAGGDGGGMLNSSSSPTLTDCTFSSNSAGDDGGGMYNEASPTLINCIFSDNSADSEGGGMFNGASSPTLINCIFWGNSAGWGGGIMSYTASTAWPVLTNCILWDNSPNQIWDDGDSPVTYSNIQGGYTGGEGNIDSYPFFVDPANGDFHLRTCSRCIDAGNNEADLPEYDFEGDDRILDGDGDGTPIVDMGVDEVVDGLPCVQVYLPVVLRGY